MTVESASGPDSHLEYVALGSSFAAGPGLGDRVGARPRGANQSAQNYAHVLAARHGLRLRDVTSSGATTATILSESQFDQPPQIEAVRAPTDLVTITIGGNDVGYVAALVAATVPTWLTRLPPLSGRFGDALDMDGLDRRLDAVGASITEVVAAVRRQAPDARVVLVDYLTVLPAAPIVAGRHRPRMSVDHQRLCRSIADRLAVATATAAREAGAELVSAAVASEAHHAWSDDPWTTSGAAVAPWRPGVPFHPNRAGMRAVADLLAGHLGLLDAAAIATSQRSDPRLTPHHSERSTRSGAANARERYA